MPEFLPLFSRPYGRQQLHDHDYHDQLNTWSARARISKIQFQTNKFKDEHGQQMWKAIPIFPKIYQPPIPLNQSHTGYGRSKEEAQTASRHILRAHLWQDEDIQLVRWNFVREERGYRAEPYYYERPALLEVPNVIGTGSSKNSAVEQSARKLLLSEYYCAYW